MLDDVFSPSRERAALAALLARAPRYGPGVPLWVLCGQGAPQEALALALASQGGAFCLAAPWPQLVAQLEARLEIAPPAPSEQEPLLAALTHALRTERATLGPLADAARHDPEPVARALLPTLQTLRAHGWRGETSVLERCCPDGAHPARLPLGLLERLLQCVEGWMLEQRQPDLVARQWALARALSKRSAGPFALAVAGVDVLAPCELAVLEALHAQGAELTVAPWVRGWTARASRPVEAPHAPRSWLEALERGEPECAEPDGTVLRLQAEDTSDALRTLARWLAGMTPAERAATMLVVPAEQGAAGRLRAALEAAGLAPAETVGPHGARDPLWQAARASLRLGWRGPSTLELLAVLHGPSSGIRGADRERLVALLRRRRPSRWSDVRALIDDATDPRHARLDDNGPVVAGGALPAVDPERAEQLEKARARLGAWLELWERAAAVSSQPGPERHERAKTLVDKTFEQLEASVRFGRDPGGVHATRGSLELLHAARAALHTELDALRERGVYPPDDPSALLDAVAVALPVNPLVDEGAPGAVRLGSLAPWTLQRPSTLVALEFVDGQWPRRPPPLALLGPLERRTLARASSVFPGLARLATDDDRELAARREALRTLTLPTGRLVLLTPARGPTGEPATEPLLVQDLLRALRPSSRSLSRPVVAGRALVASPDATLLDDLLASDDPLGALRAQRSERPWLLDRAAARSRPARDFALGAALVPLLEARTLTPRDTDLLLRCRYRFAAESLLALRDLPLGSFDGLSFASLDELAQQVLGALRAGTDATVAALLSRVCDASPAVRALTELEKLTVQRQLGRYLRRMTALRGALALDPSEAPAPEEKVLSLSVPTTEPGSPRALQLKLKPLAVERAHVGEGTLPVALLATGANPVRMAKHAANAVGSELTLAAFATAAEGTPATLVAVSVHRADASVSAPAAQSARLPERLAGHALVQASEAPSEELLAALRSELATQVDAFVAGGGSSAPHSQDKRRRLKELEVRTCESCNVWLGCRFREGA